MSKCQRCESNKLFSMNAKFNDMFTFTYQGKNHDTPDYAPNVDNICDSDYAFPEICLECGQVQGNFPVDDDEIVYKLEDIGDENEWM